MHNWFQVCVVATLLKPSNALPTKIRASAGTVNCFSSQMTMFWKTRLSLVLFSDQMNFPVLKFQIMHQKPIQWRLVSLILQKYGRVSFSLLLIPFLTIILKKHYPDKLITIFKNVCNIVNYNLCNYELYLEYLENLFFNKFFLLKILIHILLTT